MKDWSFLVGPELRGRRTRTAAAAGPLWDELLALRARGLVPRLLRGARMETRDGLFAEFAAALQFPPYASTSFDGLDECLNDLEWLPDGPLALLVLDADRILAKESQGTRDTLAELLGRAMRAWAGGENGAARALHLVLQSSRIQGVDG